MNKIISLFGAIGYDDIGDDAIFLCNVESFIKLGYRIIIFTNNIAKTTNLLKVNDLLPPNGVSDNIKIVESLGYYIDRPRNPFKYIDRVIDIFLYKLFKKRLNFFKTIYCVFLCYKLLLHIKAHVPINQFLCSYLRNIKECSLLLFIGGGYINKYWGAGIYQFIISLIIAKKLNLVTVASGQTFGPLDTIQKCLIKKHTNKLDYVSVRDVTRSKQRLIQLGCDENKIVEGPDDAIFLTADKTDAFAQYTNNFIVVANFGLFLKYSKKPLGYIYSVLSQFFDDIIENKKGIILYVSMGVSGSDYSRGLIIQNNMKFKDKFYFIPLYTEAKKIKSIIGSSDLVLSSRLHPIVFAISEKKAFIGIASGGEYYNSKLKGISEIYNYDPKNHIINADNLTVDILQKYCTRALNEKYDNDSIYKNNEIKRENFLKNIQKMIEEVR